MSEKLNVIVFGIGPSCEKYLKRYKNEHNILALSDWDPKTHGTYKYGFEIINPYTLTTLEFDKILVLSFHVNEITMQLKERCNINKDKLLIPPKYKVKGLELPFEDPLTKRFARKLIVFFNELSNNSNIDLFLDFGSLLGLVRDGDIIDWDDDIDFSINEIDVDSFVKLLFINKDNLPLNDKLLWYASVGKDSNNKIWYISLNFKNKAETLFRPFKISFTVRKFLNDRSICMGFKYLSCNREHFENNDKIKFYDEEVKAPYKYSEYLNLLYGNWREPKVYTFGASYGTSYSGSIDNIAVEMNEEVLF